MSTNPITILLADSQIDEVTALKLSIESQVGNCRVVSTDNGAHAMAIANDHDFHAVISDLRLNDMSGLKLLLRMKAACPTIKTVLMSDCATDNAKKMGLDSGVDYYIEKPIDVALLATQLGMELGPEEQTDSIFRGTLDNLNIPDALQLVIGRTSPMLMRIDSPNGVGAIEIADGQVIHARLNGRIGEQAFFELVCWTEGQFEVIDVVCSEERTIAIPLPQLLMKAAAFQSERPSIDQQSETIALEKIRQQSFFESKATAPTVNTVWENMSHYKQRESNWDQPASNKPTPRMKPIPSINAYRSSRKDTEKPLAFKKAPRQVRYSTPNVSDLISAPITSSYDRNRFRPVELPSARRLLVASLCACCMLVAGVRYFGLLETHYGRDIGASAADLVEQIAPEAGVLDQLGFLLERKVKMSNKVVIDNNSIQAHLKQDEPSEPVLRPTPAAQQWPSYTLSVQNHKMLLTAPNLIGVAAELYDQLRLQTNPWIEVQNTEGTQIGGMAVRIEAGAQDLILNTSMARVLSLSAENVSTVRMGQVSWQDKTKQSLTFAKSKDLPGRFCEYWYAVGVSLPSLQKAGLTPGETAIIRGPSGMLPVRVQLVDRGNDELIWLSKPVCDAVGVAPGSDSVKLFPNS